MAWIYPYNQDRNEYVIRSKKGKKIFVTIAPEDFFDFLNGYIARKNLNVIEGDGSEKKKEFFSRNPEALPSKKRGIFIWGCVLSGMSIVLSIVGTIKRTIDSFTVFLLAIWFIVGLVLIFLGKKYMFWKTWINNLLLKIQNSPFINMLCKIMTVTNFVSIAGLVTFASLRIEIPATIFMVLYLVSVIPFFASIWLQCGFFRKKKGAVLLLPCEELDDISYIEGIHVEADSSLFYYDVLLSGGYGWEYIKSSLDYMLSNDILTVSSISVGDFSTTKDITNSVISNGKQSCKTPELNVENGNLSLVGVSRCLGQAIRIIWFNQTRVLKVIMGVNNAELVERYVETMIRRSFGSKDELKRAKPITKQAPPVTTENQTVHIDSKAFFMWEKSHPEEQYEYCAAIPLEEREPVISLCEDSVITREYRLQTETDEDFTGKFFLISVRLGIQGDSPVPVAQIDGFISDTPDNRQMTLADIGYRMEGHFLACGGNTAKQRYEMNRGQDLVMKGLKYQGYTTPANIRLIGICPDCGKSFVFHSYSFYMMQRDVAYSDDGMDCCEITAYNIEKESWSCEIDGKTFRYYNSFNCPYCKAPYIDYKKHPENKVFGVCGCVHLGRKYYRLE